MIGDVVRHEHSHLYTRPLSTRSSPCMRQHKQSLLRTMRTAPDIQTGNDIFAQIVFVSKQNLKTLNQLQRPQEIRTRVTTIQY